MLNPIGFGYKTFFLLFYFFTLKLFSNEKEFNATSHLRPLRPEGGELHPEQLDRGGEMAPERDVRPATQLRPQPKDLHTCTGTPLNTHTRAHAHAHTQSSSIAAIAHHILSRSK